MQRSLKNKLAAGALAGSLALGIGAVAGAAAAGVGPFESDDSGLDAPGDIAESRGATTASSPGDDRLAAGSTRVDGDRIETRTFLVVADGGTQTFAAGPAGTVTIARAGNRVQIVAVSPGPGWSVLEQEQAADGHEVEVKLANGAMLVRFDAELEDGVVRVRVRQSGVTAVAAAPASSTTLDDSVDDDSSDVEGDHSGPGSDGADDDSSDDGTDDDSSDVDGDHSGPGPGSDGADDAGSVDRDHSGPGRDGHG